MKNLLKLSILVFFITAMFSCGSSVNNNLPPQERLQGEWEITEAEGPSSDLNIGTIYTFKDNVMTTGGAASGRFTISDSLIVWDLGSMQMNYVFHFEENTLVLELNSGQKLFLVKK